MQILAGESELGVAQCVEKIQCVSSPRNSIHTGLSPSAALRPGQGQVLEGLARICPPCPLTSFQLWVTPHRHHAPLAMTAKPQTEAPRPGWLLCPMQGALSPGAETSSPLRGPQALPRNNTDFSVRRKGSPGSRCWRVKGRGSGVGEETDGPEPSQQWLYEPLSSRMPASWI